LKLELDFTKPFNYLKAIAKKLNIVHIFLIVLALHLFIMSTPSDGFIFDEAHYVPASRDTINMIAANAEHTPLSKMFIGWSIQAFGDWWFAWRLPSVVFSSLSVVFVYLIASHFMQKKYALFAGAFMSLDVLFFINGSIAILDPPAIFFALVGTYYILKDKYVWSSIAFGIAVLSKETSLLILAGVAIYKLSIMLKQNKFKPKFIRPDLKAKSGLLKTFKLSEHRTTKTFGLFFILFIAIIFGGIWAYDIVYKPSTGATTQVGAVVYVDEHGSAFTTSYNTIVAPQGLISNPIQHIIFAFNYYKGLTPTINPEPQDLRPAWSWALPLVNAFNAPQYFGVSVSSGDVSTSVVSYRSQVSYPISVFIVPTLILAIFLIIRKTEDKFPLLYLAWIGTTYLPWILFSIFVQKMTFNYYFMYTTPILSIGLAWFFMKLPLSDKVKTYSLTIILSLVIVFFIYYFPISMFRA
jgi:hypothetical protein